MSAAGISLSIPSHVEKFSKRSLHTCPESTAGTILWTRKEKFNNCPCPMKTLATK
jgi:hypothetical protein